MIHGAARSKRQEERASPVAFGWKSDSRRCPEPKTWEEARGKGRGWINKRQKAGSCQAPGGFAGTGECHGGERREREGSKRQKCEGDTTALRGGGIVLFVPCLRHVTKRREAFPARRLFQKNHFFLRPDRQRAALLFAPRSPPASHPPGTTFAPAPTIAARKPSG